MKKKNNLPRLRWKVLKIMDKIVDDIKYLPNSKRKTRLLANFDRLWITLTKVSRRDDR